MPEVPPRRAVAVDSVASLPRIGALGRAMRDGIDKEQGVTSFHVDFNRAPSPVNRGIGSHAIFFKVGVLEISFVTTRDHHRPAVAGAKVGKRQQDVDLSTLKAAIIDLKLGAFGVGMTAGVETNRFAGTTKVGKVFVNKERAVVVIKGTFAADEIFDLLDPRRVVDQLFKRFARFINLLQIQSVGGAKGVGMNVPPPLAHLQRRNRIQTGVAFVHFRFGQGIFQNQIAVEIKEIDF